MLRPGNAHAARGARPLLRRIIGRIKARLGSAQIRVRADSGFCVPGVLETLEPLNDALGDIEYVIGIGKNSRLLEAASAAIKQAQDRFEEHKCHVRDLSQVSYAAKTGSHPRHVVVKAEHHPKGAHPRFVVTTLSDFDPQLTSSIAHADHVKMTSRT